MVIKELILQGVRRFTEPVRLPMGDGLNVVHGANDRGKTTVSDALFFLFSLSSPSPSQDNAAMRDSLKSDAAGDIRLGAVFQEGPDGFRLLGDVASGAVVLSKLNRETKKYDTVYKDAGDIRAFIKTDLLFKPVDRYKDLYLLDARKLIALSSQASPAAGREAETKDATDVTDGPGVYTGEPEDFGFVTRNAVAEPNQNSMSEEEIRAEIDRLEGDLRLASGVSDKQGRIEQLDAELTDTVNRLNDIDGMASTIRDMEGQLGAMKSFSGLPEDIEKRIDEYLKSEEDIKKQIEAIEAQKQQYTAAGSFVPPFYRDRTFLIGGIIGLSFVVIPVVLSILLGSWALYLLIGVFPGIFTMGFALWKDAVRKNEFRKSQQSVDMLEKQIKEQKKKYEIEGSVILSIVSSLGLGSPGDLKEGIEKYRYTAGQLERTKKDYAAVSAEHNVGSLKEKEEKLKLDIDAVREELRTAASSDMDPYLITQQIETLKKELEYKGTRKPPQAQRPAVRERPPAPQKQAQPAAPAFMAYIDTVSGLLGDPRERVASLVSSRAGVDFSALTHGRFQDVTIADGTITVVPGSGKASGLEALSDSERERCMLAVFLAALGLAAQRWPWPVVMDDPFVALDDTNRTVAYNAVKSLSKETQVIFLTRDGGIKPFADAFIEL